MQSGTWVWNVTIGGQGKGNQNQHWSRSRSGGQQKASAVSRKTSWAEPHSASTLPGPSALLSSGLESWHVSAPALLRNWNPRLTTFILNNDVSTLLSFRTLLGFLLAGFFCITIARRALGVGENPCFRVWVKESHYLESCYHTALGRREQAGREVAEESATGYLRSSPKNTYFVQRFPMHNPWGQPYGAASLQEQWFTVFWGCMSKKGKNPSYSQCQRQPAV